MHLAIKTDPYFFKVNKIKFKPYDCDEEMEFIEMHWPIHLDDLYESPSNDVECPKNGWSGPMFNHWATKDSNAENASPNKAQGSFTYCTED